METAILSEVTALFRQSSIVWAEAMRPFLEGILFDLIQLEWFFLGLGYLFRIDAGFLFTTMIRFLMSNGFALFMVRYGWNYVGSWFEGVKHLAYFLGCPPLDPGAVAAFGPVVTDPIMKSLADQGFLSYATNPASYFFGFSGMAINLAFCILAFILMGLLLMSYLLTAACPWFFAWWGLSFTRGITLGYIRLVFGTMNGLFCVMLMVAVVSELGERLQLLFAAKFTGASVAALTWRDYSVPFTVGVVLCGVFVWIPYQWVKAVDGIVADWGGGRMLLGMGSTMVGGAGQAISGGQSGRSTSQSTTPQQISAPQQGANMNTSTTTQPSQAWGRTRS